MLPLIPSVVSAVLLLQVNKRAAYLLKLHLHHLANLIDKVMCRFFFFFCILFQARFE